MATECWEFEKLIDQLADGALSDEERAFVVAHSLRCESCREIRRQAAELDNMLKTEFSRAPELDLDWLALKVHERVSVRRGGLPVRHSRLFRRVAAVAAVAAGILAIWLLAPWARKEPSVRMAVTPTPTVSGARAQTEICIPAVNPSCYLFVNVAASPVENGARCQPMRKGEGKERAAYVVIVVGNGF